MCGQNKKNPDGPSAQPGKDNLGIPRQGVLITPQSTVTDVLAAIDNWARFTVHDPVALWNILSALRGPDDRDYDQKLRTTAVIRRASVPNLALRAGAIVAAPNDAFYQTDFEQDRESHFDVHVRRAAGALGLL